MRRELLSTMAILTTVQTVAIAQRTATVADRHRGSSALVSSVRPGQLVRLSAPAYGVRSRLGRFLSAHRDTLTVQTDSILSIPFAAVTRLEVSGGADNVPVFVGIGLGMLAGAVVGIACGPEADPSMWFRYENTPIVTAVGGALIGGFVGGLIGKAFRGERWEYVPLDRFRVGANASRDRFALSLSLSF